MSSEPSFAIPAWPERRFPRVGGVEYEGGAVFHLTPEDERTETELQALVEDVLADGPYRSGDFLDLPLALWLVRDEETTDVFRVSVRDDTVRLHVLPETESLGLARFYERAADRLDCEWRVECEVG